MPLFGITSNCQHAMVGITSNKGVVMAIRKSSSRPDPKKGVHKCTHCNGDNHVIDTCFKLHGYPDWHPKGKTVSPKPHNPTTEGSVPKSHLVTTSRFVSKLGMTNSTINLPFFTGHSAWIIDTGAIDHMTYDKKKKGLAIYPLAVQNQLLLMPMVCLP